MWRKFHAGPQADGFSQRQTRHRLLSAFGVALATIGCAPPGPKAPVAATEAMRERIAARLPLGLAVSFLRAGGKEGARVILVHGTPGSATGWTDYLVNPPSHVEIVALDRPGFGQSEPEGAVTALAAQAAAVAALLPDDGRTVVLIGHSLGGPVVARVAADHPQRISAVVFLAASLDPGLETIHPMQRVGAWSPVRAMLPRAIRNANAELMALKQELEVLAAALPDIRAKVIIMHGTRDDLVPVANVAYMQGRLTGARCVRTVLLDGHNHFLPWNSADSVRHAIDMALDPTC